MFKPTAAQQAAIESKENTLVSAAAGSGKTAVLVQRVLQAFCNAEAPLMADRALIVTFTNAAAAELKLRIEKELGKALDRDPYNTLLQKQKILLSNAKICTIDSFCINFIRDNFEKAGIDPSFKMADNSDIRMLLSSSVSRLMNDEFNSGNREFLDLLDFVGSNYDDTELTARILNIFSYSRKMPFSDNWVLNVLKDYEEFALSMNDDWFSEGISIFKENIEEAYRIIKMSAEALELNADAYDKYKDSIYYLVDFSESLLSLCRKNDWDGIFRKIQDYSVPKLLSLSAAKKDANSEYAKIRRDDAKKLLESSFKLIYGTKEELRDEIRFSLPHLRKMSELVIRLGEIFEEELKSRSLMTFDMAEQTALSLLAEYKDGKICRKTDADEFISQFDEVLVDEYQDVNNLQDTLFNILSDDQKKLFCVGDAKQSIYRFRGANPYNFILKKKIYREADEKDRNGLRIDLSGNFRSRREICEYVNSLFGFIMHEDNADIEYDERERLEPLATFPENSETKVETHFADLTEITQNFDFSEYESGSEKNVAEAHIIAKTILDTVNAKPFIKTDSSLRKADFGDIVILLRSLDAAPIISSVLKKCSIPVSITASDILSTDEVATLISLLTVINNPFDDVALLTLMTSRLYGFTIDSLAKYRAKSRKGKLISALAMTRDDPKLSDFLADLSYYREKNITLRISELIDEIFERTNFTGMVSRLPDGEIKKSNLITVRNFAATFEGEGKRSLREFLKALEDMSDKDFGTASSAPSNSVRIITIHSSKGLQYPVCILADTDHQFNFSDCYKSLLLNEKHGFSFKYYDEETFDKNETLLRVIMSEYEKRQVLSEEVRLLYVALTRAEEKLIITAAVKDLKKKIDSLSDMGYFENGRMRKYNFGKTNCYFDWIFALDFMMNSEKYLDYSNKNISSEGIYTDIGVIEGASDVRFEADSLKADILKENYAKSYPFSELLSIQSKASVTSIVHKADESKYQFMSRPAFMNEGGLTAAEKGTATHKFMQFCDFGKAEVSVENEKERLYEMGFLSSKESEAVSIEQAEAFFRSGVFQRIKDSVFVKREMNFLTEFPASIIKADLADELSNEKIIVQGSVDLLFEEDGKLVIVDFKTDRNKSEEELISAYAEQLKIYGKACESLLKKPIGELLIYSFSIGKTISL